MSAAALEPAERQLEKAYMRLQRVAGDLDALLCELALNDGAAAVHEALGTIMETMRVLGTAHGRLRARPLRVLAGDDD